jgi:hypothetical protein
MIIYMHSVMKFVFAYHTFDLQILAKKSLKVPEV